MGSEQEQSERAVVRQICSGRRKLRWIGSVVLPHASAAGLMGFGDLGSWASAGATAWVSADSGVGRGDRLFRM